jgi:hypothetical protein
VHKLTCLLLGAMPLASQAHTGSGTGSLLHSLQHGGEYLPLLAILAGGSWLLYRLRGRS